MKTNLIISFLVLLVICSCDLLGTDDESSIGGEHSPMADVGAKVTGSSLSGVTDAFAQVTALNDGVSTFSGEATITNQALLNLISNIPEFSVNGNKVNVSGLKFKITKEGVESMVSSYPGILVKYDSSVGDTYKAKSGVERKVISKSTDNDYPYYFYNIKVIKVEESPSLIPGAKKVVYIANHRFGIVGIEMVLEDNTTLKFTTGSNVEND